IRYLELSGRPAEQIRLVEAYAKAQGMFPTAGAPEAEYSDTLELDLSTVEPSLAGPRRPQDRVPLHAAKASFEAALKELIAANPPKGGVGRPAPNGGTGRAAPGAAAAVSLPVVNGTTAPGGGPATARAEPAAADGSEPAVPITHGSVVIAAITSCTNTSNPSV